jgi:hypothetical protein
VTHKNNSVVFAIATFYQSLNETRFKLACTTISNALKAGHAVSVVDGSPNPEVAKHFSALGAKVFPQLHESLGASKQQSFFHAVQICREGGYTAVLAVEGEKDLARAVPKLLREMRDGKSHIVVPERNDAGWNSYPDFQKESEQAANRVFEEVTGLKSDIFFGPVLFRPTSKVAGYFIAPMWLELGFPNTYTQHLAVLQAHADRLLVRNIPIDFLYPELQRVEEEGVLTEEMKRKREQQFNTVTLGYRNAMKVLSSRSA